MATVLIVDDSSMARRNLKNILISAGHTVLAEATNGVQAFVEYENHKPDFVTMDINMPILNGIDGTKKILRAYPNAKVIIVSALNKKLMILSALQNGAKHYIVKPYSYEKVIEVVNEVLQLSCKLSSEDFTSTIAQKQSKSSLSTLLVQQKKNESIVTRPFFIENKNGISVINISKCMCNKNLPALKLGIQRISQIKPIRIIFNFGDIEVIDENTFNGIKEIFKNILTLDGSCIMTSSNQNFVLNISGKENSLPIKLCSGKLNISELDI